MTEADSNPGTTRYSARRAAQLQEMGQFMATNLNAGLALADVLSYVAEQLLEAERQALERSKTVMQFEECEVELAVKLESAGEAGIKVWVINLGGSVKHEEANRIKVKFKAMEGGGVQMPSISASSAGPALARQSKRGASAEKKPS